MIVVSRVKNKGKTVGYYIGYEKFSQYVSLPFIYDYADRVENARIVNGYFVKKRGCEDIREEPEYPKVRKKKAVKRYTTGLVITARLEIGWKSDVAYVIKDMSSGCEHIYSKKKAKKLKDKLENACIGPDGSLEMHDIDEDLKHSLNAYTYSRKQIEKITKRSVKQRRYKDTIRNAEKRLEIEKQMHESVKKAGIFEWFERGSHYEELTYEEISSIQKSEEDLKRIEQYRLRESVVRQTNLTADGIFRPASISGNVVYIPDEAIAVDSSFIYRISRMAKNSGILRSEIVITGGRNLKYIAYDMDELNSYNESHYPIKLRLKDTRTGFICGDKSAEGITIKPDSLTFLQMLIDNKKYRGDYRARGYKVEISRKLLGKYEAPLIACIYEDSKDVRGRYFKLGVKRDTAGRLFNKALMDDLRQYYRYLSAVPKIDEYTINRKAVRKLIISRIEDAGYKVRDISGDMKWDIDRSQWEYEDAPGVLRAALGNLGVDDIEDICLYDIAEPVSWKLTKRRAETYKKIIEKAVDLSYNERYIVGCIEAEGILADEKVTQFSLCIDSRCRLRMTKIWDEPGKDTFNRVGEYINIDDLLNNRWNGSGQYLVKIGNKEVK